MDLDKWYEEGWSDENPIVIPPWDSDEEEDDDDDDDDDDEPTKADTSSNHTLRKPPSTTYCLNASLGLEEYVSEQDGEDGDNEVSVTSSGSEACMDAPSTLSEHGEDEFIPHPTDLVALERTGW